MSSIELVQVFDATLRGAECAFGAGIQVVLGTEQDGTHAIANLILGLSSPRRGTVRVGGVDPHRSPETRRRIGALLGYEPAPMVSSVTAAVGSALRLRGDSLDPAALLGQIGLSSVASARPHRIPNGVWRDVLLGLALNVPNPVALVLVEPLATGLSRNWVRERLAAFAAAGVSVLALTSSPLDASELGGSIVLLDQGRFVRRPGTPLALELAPGGTLVLRVRSDNQRKLAARLVQDPAVAALDLSGDGDQLTVRGADPDALGLAIARAARELEVKVSAIEPTLPALDDARAASAALWRAAYDAAYRAGQAHARARAEAWRAAQPRTLESLQPAAPPSSLPPGTAP